MVPMLTWHIIAGMAGRAHIRPIRAEHEAIASVDAMRAIGVIDDIGIAGDDLGYVWRNYGGTPPYRRSIAGKTLLTS